MANPTAPLEGGSAKVHFLTAHGNTPEFWVAVEDGTNAGSTSVGWAGVATHVEGDTLTAPGGTTTTAAPVVLVAGDDGSNVIPLQMSGADLKITLDSEAVVLGTGAAAIGKLAAGTAEIGKVQNAGTFAVQVDGAALTALQLIDNAISGSEMQVDIVSGNVTNAGTFVVQIDGAALTALQLIDDAISGSEMQVDVITLPTLASVTTVDTLTTITNDVSIDDGGNSITIDGDVGDNGPGFTPLYKYDNKAAANEEELWDPTLNYLYITDIIISSIAANNVSLGFGAAGTEETILKATLDVKGGLTHQFRSPIKSTDSGDNLYITCSAADEVNITVCGYESNS